ncbi:MAG: hypothetical protein WCG92_16755 [Hyphomicrobiales bacterium]
MAARQSKSQSPRKHRLTKSRFQRMVRELEYLDRKYDGDLDKVIPSVKKFIEEAKNRLGRFDELPRGGAPKLWIQGQLVRLWRLVRAIRMGDPQLDDREACRRLALAGFWVYAHDPRAIGVEDVRVLITNPDTLRRRLGDANKSLHGHDDVIYELEQEAALLSRHPQLKPILLGKKSKMSPV